MAVQEALQATSLLVQIADLAHQLLWLRQQPEASTEETEGELLGLLIEVFDELRFCQDVRDDVREFQSRFKLAVTPLDQSKPPDTQIVADEIQKWLELTLIDRLGDVVATKQDHMSALDVTDLADSELCDALLSTASSYERMIGQIQALVGELPGTIDHYRRNQLTISGLRLSTLKKLDDIHDCQLEAVSGFIRLGALVGRLIRGMRR